MRGMHEQEKSPVSLPEDPRPIEVGLTAWEEEAQMRRARLTTAWDKAVVGMKVWVGRGLVCFFILILMGGAAGVLVPETLGWLSPADRERLLAWAREALTLAGAAVVGGLVFSHRRNGGG